MPLQASDVVLIFCTYTGSPPPLSIGSHAKRNRRRKQKRSSLYTYFTSEDITLLGIGATTGVNAVASYYTSWDWSNNRCKFSCIKSSSFKIKERSEFLSRGEIHL
jgi:hypothetical protein